MVVTENVFAVTKTRIICLVGLKLVPIFWKFSIFYFSKIVHHMHMLIVTFHQLGVLFPSQHILKTLK